MENYATNVLKKVEKEEEKFKPHSILIDDLYEHNVLRRNISRLIVLVES